MADDNQDTPSSETYLPLGDWKLPDCCNNENPDEPQGCDCCYDSWNNELKEVTQQYNQANEDANQLQTQLVFITGRRDKLKIWVDELDTMDELANDVYQKFEVINSQVKKICINSDTAVKSIKILFCMTKDFFKQMDKIKEYVDVVKNCITCINRSELGPGTGLKTCLDVYEEKLLIVLGLRDDLIKLVMKVIKSAYMLNKDICKPYGLSYLINEWISILNGDKLLHTGAESGKNQDCELQPFLTFAIRKDEYTKEVKSKYKDDKVAVETLMDGYLDAKKRKEALTACVNSLNAGIKEVNPGDRCK